jgi:hypothetical protein
LSMEDDTIFRHRYHVFMRKNKQKWTAQCDDKFDAKLFPDIL